MEDSKALRYLVYNFKFEKLLNQDQAGRRITLLGSNHNKPGLLIIERAAFPSNPRILEAIHRCLSGIKILGTNDIYHWYLALGGSVLYDGNSIPELKLNLIYPCTEKHIKKYSPQGLRTVTEDSKTYFTHVRPYIARQREEGRLDWVFNILEGKKEQKDIIYRDLGGRESDDKDEAFVLTPDLNWDRETMTSLHLLALVERRDIWSLRDLQKRHVEWLKHMKRKMIKATVAKFPDIEADQLKLYMHYQPTFYHLHIHVVHVMLEPTGTQAMGKAFGLENVISQLESLAGGPEAGMADLTLTYTLGENHDLWDEVFLPLKLKRDE
ncbi:MAG: hypothetical protein Q9220_002783 [cf. Caloplaca sp. 1 TL-2023]